MTRQRRMIYEEFKALALNQPRRDEETIFEVIEYDVKDLPGRKRNHYPKFNVRHYRVGICHTLPEAETLMHKAIERAKGYNDEIYCFHIKEFPMGELMGFIWENYGESWRLYDGQGQFLDKTYCSALECDHRTIYGRYRGRHEDSFRFKEGDIVEVLDGDEVRLAVATGSGRSIEWHWKMWQRIKRKEDLLYNSDYKREMTDYEVEEAYFPDASDDQIPVIDGPSYATHDHVHTLNIMPLRYLLSKKLRQRYDNYYKAMLKEEYMRREETHDDDSDADVD